MRQPQLSSEETRLRESGDNIAAAVRALRAEGKISKVVEPMTKIVPGLQDIHVDEVGRYLALKFKQSQAGSVADFKPAQAPRVRGRRQGGGPGRAQPLYSDSFDKLIRTLADLFEVRCPPRPRPSPS